MPFRSIFSRPKLRLIESSSPIPGLVFFIQSRDGRSVRAAVMCHRAPHHGRLNQAKFAPLSPSKIPRSDRRTVLGRCQTDVLNRILFEMRCSAMIAIKPLSGPLFALILLLHEVSRRRNLSRVRSALTS